MQHKSAVVLGSRGKIDKMSNQEKTLEIVEKAEGPVDVKFVAKQLGVAWATARALLMNLLVERKVQGMKTRNGWIYATGDKLQKAITR